MIVHVFNSSIISGPETLVIPQLNKLEEEVVVIFLSEKRKKEDSKSLLYYAQQFGLDVEVVFVKKRYDKDAICELRKVLEKLHPRIVHAHDVKASSYTLWATRKIKIDRPKLVSTHHGVRGRYGIKVKLFESFYTRFILPHFDATLAVCTSDRDILIKRGLKREKVFLHLNGIDRTLIDFSTRNEKSLAIRKSWDIELDSEEELVLGYVGRLAKGKGIERVLYVLSQLQKEQKCTNWEFLVFGKGPLEDPLCLLTKELGLADKVKFMGYRKEIGNELAGLDLLILLSDAEGLPISLLEAGWAGTPIFCTAIDGICDLVDWNVKHFLFPADIPNGKIAEQLAFVLNNSAERDAFALKFQKQVRSKFSATVWINRLKEIYTLI